MSVSDAAPVTPYALTAARPALVSADDSTDTAKNIDAVSQDFEAVFLTQMMSAMFEGDDLNSFFGGGSTGDIYKSYLLNEYGKMMAQGGGIGIASVVKQELMKLQEVHKP